MNTYGTIILLALVADYAVELGADILNLRALGGDPPPDMADVYDPEQYRRSQEYLRVNTRFDWMASTVGLIALLVFWFAGGFDALDRLVRAIGLSVVPTGLIYTAALLGLKLCLGLPFEFYSTFRIEARFGFNRTTPATFVLDKLKTILLTAVIGGPLLAGLFAFFRYVGPFAWLYCWGITVAFVIVIQFVAPRWIMPLFNTFTPLAAGGLREGIEAYAAKVGFPLAGLFVIDGSRRSTKSNAFFTGFGRHKRIALYDTLVTRHTVAELVAVVAHEIGHYKRKHIQQGLLISIAHTGILFYLLSVFLTHRGLFDTFGMTHMSVYAGFIFFGLLYTPIQLVLSFFLNAFMRHNEYQADRFAAETTGQPQALVDALKKLSRDNLANLTPHPFYVALHYSHPPLVDRVRALTAR